MSELPKVPSKWVHYKGNEYEVYDLLNTDADPGREVDHPVIVCYRGANGRKWGKTLEAFLNTMEPKKESAWEARKKRVSLQAPTFIPQDNQSSLPFRPKIDLWNPEIQSLASFYVASSSDDATKLEFVYALWDGQFSNEVKSTIADTSDVWRQMSHLDLKPITASMRDSLHQAHIPYACTVDRHLAFATTFTSSEGVDLRAFAAIVYSLCKAIREGASVLDVQGLYMVADHFNESILPYVNSRLFHISDTPKAVVEGDDLFIVLPQNVAPRSKDTHKLQIQLFNYPNIGLLWHPDCKHLSDLFTLFEDSWNAHITRS